MDKRQHKNLKEIDERIIQDLIDLLFFQYPKAKESIISYECNANKMPAYAFTELRDFIDHLNLALHQEMSSKDIPHHLAQAEEHLRRAVVEPYQGIVQDEIKNIQELFDKYQKCWFKSLPLVQAKTINLSEYNALKREIHDLFEKGRKLKSCNIWSDDFENALQDCFVPAYNKCLLLKQKLIDSLQISKERTERVVLAVTISLVIYVLTSGIPFIGRCISSYFSK